MSYAALKIIHVISVIFSYLLFILLGIWMMQNSHITASALGKNSATCNRYHTAGKRYNTGHHDSAISGNEHMA